MGFFSDLKEDLSQAVNELMPEEEMDAISAEEGGEIQKNTAEEELPAVESSPEVVPESTQEPEMGDDSLSLAEMLKNIDEIQVPDESENTAELEEAAALVEESFAKEEEVQETETTKEAETDINLEDMLKSALESDSVYATEKAMESKGAEKKMDSFSTKTATDETSIITAGMVIAGDVSSEGNMEVIGTINGDIDILGKLNVTGYITGNSKAAEIYAEGAKINGEVVSEGAVKIGSSSVVIGNITASSAVIAGAVKGDIDVKGPVILDASAIVMGNIKSKSVQINIGAVIEGMCSQCYADVSPTSFYDEYNPELKKGKTNYTGEGLCVESN